MQRTCLPTELLLWPQFSYNLGVNMELISLFFPDNHVSFCLQKPHPGPPPSCHCLQRDRTSIYASCLESSFTQRAERCCYCLFLANKELCAAQTCAGLFTYGMERPWNILELLSLGVAIPQSTTKQGLGASSPESKMSDTLVEQTEA